MFERAFAGRRVLITGDTGFKGAWLSSWLLALGAEVTGYALEPPTTPSLFDALDLHNDVRQVIADIRDQDRLSRAIAVARPEVVFHLAAQSLVREGYERPHETFDTNVMGTVNVLETARGSDAIEAVVVVTSDKCYRNIDAGHPFREDDPMGGHDPYSASKGCAELVVAAYHASFFGSRGPTIASVRAGNVIGGGDWSRDRIIPDCVRALMASERVIVRNPDAVRPWQHVLEPLSGYLRLASLILEHGRDYGGAWNFGPSDIDSSRSVRWLVERFLESWGSGTWSPATTTELLPEARLLGLDSSKARTRLGWGPTWNAESAVNKTADWYRAHAEGLDPTAARALVGEQIRAFEAERGVAIS